MSVRLEKISTLIKHELAIIFQRESRNLFEGAFITVTQVRVSPDLSYARVYLSFFTKDKKEEQLKVVQQHTPIIRKMLGLVVGKQMRKIPELAFFIDDSLDYAEEIDKLLKS
ncbi:MAG TPA: 30S ribosome-binding factor RbfA [Luteibaculaceae bacterium]|nr:30S ribosome-binding factor RbfA [Luteibaculaceae bacterium]